MRDMIVFAYAMLPASGNVLHRYRSLGIGRRMGDRMADIAGAPESHVSGKFSGYFDRYETGRASGWVANLVSPQTIVSLVVIIDGAGVGHVLCDEMRPDVRDALGLASARVGFTYTVPENYLDRQPHVLSFLLPDGSVLSHMGADGIDGLSPALEFNGAP